VTQEDSQTETGVAPFDLLEGTSASTRAKTTETFLELLGARVRNPNTRSAYRVAWRSFLAFCSARQLKLESVKAYHVGAWLDQHPGSRSTQRQHLAAVRLLFDSLMMRGVVEYNPAARAKPPRLVRESSHTPVFEEAEIITIPSLSTPRTLQASRFNRFTIFAEGRKKWEHLDSTPGESVQAKGRLPLFASTLADQLISYPRWPTATASRSRVAIAPNFRIRVMSRANPCGLSSTYAMIPQ
jgi:hypothetical protein